VNYGLGRGFLDAGGSSTIQAVGGLAALSIAWILGPRRGKYTQEHMPVAIPGHNAVLVLFGCLLAWIGWSGLNCAGALLFAGPPVRAPLVVVNTTLAAMCASLAAAAITRARFGKPDASLCANGWVAGLVASSAPCASVRPAPAMLIGLVAGALVVFSVEWLEFRLTVDDPGGAVSVHALGGVWGILAAGLFSAAPGQWLAQFVGIATLLGFVLPLVYALNWLLDRVYPQRVPPQGERQGLDLHELGAGAYPEFMSHNDDLWQR
jgi:Amt family ammonium transporter